MTPSEVMAVVRRDRVFYEESGGGVTFSGGEPLAQAPFLAALLEAAKADGFSTAVDTCGFAPPSVLVALAPLVDLFLYDIKLLDAARHRQVVGVPLAPILTNLEALSRAGARLWIRVPIVPTLTDGEAGLAAIAQLAASLGTIERVSLLPYHATGSGKFVRLGKTYALTDVRPPAPADMENLATLFRARGLDVRIGG